MASIDETGQSTVVAGANPDSVEVEPRIWRLAPLRQRDPAPAVYTDAGLDLYLFGDPDADATPVTIAGVVAGTRNGAKRALDPEGDPTLWCEPSPMRYDRWSAVSQDLSLSGPVGAPGSEYPLGVFAEIDVDADDGFPLLVTAVINIDGALLDALPTSGLPPRATLQSEILGTTTPLTGSQTISSGTRDIFYGLGGSTTIVMPTVLVPVDANYTFRTDLVMAYRADVPETFPIAIQGLSVGLQVIELTSAGP